LTANSDIALLIAVFGAHKNNKITGRTRIQKEICVLKYKSKIPFTFEYKSYFYGPYSEELSETINTLVGVKLLKETVTATGYNSYRYDYFLTEKGKELFQKLNHDANGLINKLQKQIKTLDQLDTPDLVSYAKAVSGLDSIC